MKRSVIVSAILIAVYYLVRQLLGREDEETIASAPRQKHLTNAFSKAKQHAVAATEDVAM